MKQVWFLLTLIILSCSAKDRKKQILSKTEMDEIIKYTISLSSYEGKKIFCKYGNTEMEPLINVLYRNNNDRFKYSIEKEIIRKIENRKNSDIDIDFSSFSELIVFCDTINIKENFIVFSEPIFLDNNLIIISLLLRCNNKEDDNQWAYFFTKNKNGIQLETFFDWKKNRFFSETDPPR